MIILFDHSSSRCVNLPHLKKLHILSMQYGTKMILESTHFNSVCSYMIHHSIFHCDSNWILAHKTMLSYCWTDLFLHPWYLPSTISGVICDSLSYWSAIKSWNGFRAAGMSQLMRERESECVYASDRKVCNSPDLCDCSIYHKNYPWLCLLSEMWLLCVCIYTTEFKHICVSVSVRRLGFYG